MKLKFIILFFFILDVNCIYSQEKDSVQVQIKKFNKTLSFVTDALIQNGIRIELELPFNKNNYLSISPTYFLSDKYLKEKKQNNYYKSEIIETTLPSCGLDVSYKYQLWNDERKITPYFALNGFFKWHRKELDGSKFYDSATLLYFNGNTFYYFHDRTYYLIDVRKVDILSYGADISVGSKFEIVPRIVFDFSLGFRYTHRIIGENDGGFYSKSDNEFEDFKDFGFAGFMPIGFYKIGFKF